MDSYFRNSLFLVYPSNSKILQNRRSLLVTKVAWKSKTAWQNFVALSSFFMLCSLQVWRRTVSKTGIDMTCSVWCNGMSQILRVSRRHGAVAAVISAIIFNKYCNSSQICSLRSVKLRTQYTPSKLFGCSLHKYRILTPFQHNFVIRTRYSCFWSNWSFWQKTFRMFGASASK